MYPVSVLMSCYNSAQWLPECIDSVLTQKFRNFEFIILDDGSEDNTPAILNNAARLDSRVRVFRKSNTGLSDSLNFGFNYCRGKWIARIDADDLCHPDRLSHQVELAESNESIVFVGSNHNEIDEFGHQTKSHCYPTDDGPLKLRLHKFKTFVSHSSALFRLQTVQRLNGYRGALQRAEDLDLWLRLSRLGEFRSVALPLVSIRKHRFQISNASGGRRQFIDAFASTLAFHIHSVSGVDPIDQTKTLVEDYLLWCERLMEDMGLFREREAWNSLKALLVAHPPLPQRLILAWGAIGDIKPLLSFYFSKHFGISSLQYHARRWVSYHSRSNRT